MMENFFKKMKFFLASRKYKAAVFLVMFLLGYNVMMSRQQSDAQIMIMPSLCPWCLNPCGSSGRCEFPFTAMLVENAAIAALETMLAASATVVQAGQQAMVNTMVTTLLTRIQLIETNMMAWWDTMWEYSMLPSLQKMTRQLNTALTDQSRSVQSMLDASAQVETQFVLEKNAIRDHRVQRPSIDNVCAVTPTGGWGRATTFSRAMREVWARESQACGMNKFGTPCATAAAGAERQRYDEYKNTFCDPAGNGGTNDCGPSLAPFRNADAQPTKFIYDKLTINMGDNGDAAPLNTDGERMAKAVETINNNLIGVPSADPISQGALESASGQETFLDRRSYLARHGAIRAIPQMVTGWRVPGSQMGPYVNQLRVAAGIPAGDISDNPSYREVMHAISIDRFNSGKYALGMITDESSIEMEKLTLSAFYLMQLRDYYELMERTALTLAVQVSLMVDEVPLPAAVPVAPLQ